MSGEKAEMTPSKSLNDHEMGQLRTLWPNLRAV
jgi:hypothetical protein